ncbi:MAG: prephenate dehydratase [Bacteroidetes bacterium HGW-Bacteroidetes-4]|nr:MAG: prephenate dehydratase [Bacteroidetes bacterium HGW-Bacteroidetes-4]
MHKVAIQGGHGAFHEIAARSFFPNARLDLIPCETFEQITDMLVRQEIDYGIMAIENTVAGSLIPNYALIRETPVKIIGEKYLRIKQNLLALPGQKIEDLTEVHSHYMAIAQTRKFFNQYPHIKLVESADTALSAKKIQEKKLVGKGAIASDLAATLYGLEILAAGIETNKRNYTRFLILNHKDNFDYVVETRNKASLCFSLPHHKGSLSQVLSILAFYDHNLTKIQSMPIVGQEFKYFFYVDLTFDSFERYQQSISAITPLVVDLQILGEYQYGIDSLETIHNQ